VTPLTCRVVNDAQPCARGEIQVRRVDDSLQVAACPRHAGERFELGDALDHTRAGSIERHDVGGRMGVRIQLGVDLSVCRQRTVDLVQQPSRELARLDLELGTRGTIDDTDRNDRAKSCSRPPACASLGPHRRRKMPSMSTAARVDIGAYSRQGAHVRRHPLPIAFDACRYFAR